MNEISLINSTGNRQVDDILRGIVGLFEMAFPNRIRGYYLCGSYIDGSAIPCEDWKTMTTRNYEKV